METLGLKYLKGKKFFVTGHTGFKGSWLCAMLLEMGADVYGYALKPDTDPSLFDFLNLDISSTFGDIRDYENLKKSFENSKADYVIHLAAQPLVLEGYENPRYTYDVNVMGTVNILECVRNSNVTACLNVTTDKVYFNDEREIPFKESDILDGNSPYENSKSCSELVTNTYRRSFDMPPLFTARAGNVIGGGDFSDNRIIPDCFRAISKGEKMIIRNPNSVRPFQLVSECLYSYLLLLSKPEKAGSYNIGPLTDECINTETLVKKFYDFWNKAEDRVGDYEIKRNVNAPSEAKFLQLNSSLFRENYSHSPKWNIDTAIEKTAEWYKAYLNNENKTFEQIREILK